MPQATPTADTSGTGKLNLIGRSNASIYFEAELKDDLGEVYDLTDYDQAELVIKKKSGSQPIVSTSTLANNLSIDYVLGVFVANIPPIPHGDHTWGLAFSSSTNAVRKWVIFEGDCLIEKGTG